MVDSESRERLVLWVLATLIAVPLARLLIGHLAGPGPVAAGWTGALLFPVVVLAVATISRLVLGLPAIRRALGLRQHR